MPSLARLWVAAGGDFLKGAAAPFQDWCPLCAVEASTRLIIPRVICVIRSTRIRQVDRGGPPNSTVFPFCPRQRCARMPRSRMLIDLPALRREFPQ